MRSSSLGAWPSLLSHMKLAEVFFTHRSYGSDHLGKSPVAFHKQVTLVRVCCQDVRNVIDTDEEKSRSRPLFCGTSADVI